MAALSEGESASSVSSTVLNSSASALTCLKRGSDLHHLRASQRASNLHPLRLCYPYRAGIYLSPLEALDKKLPKILRGTLF
jgi:hypothetical protein